jgi:hypothetical protein
MLEYPHAYAYFLLPLAVWVGMIEVKTGQAALGPVLVPKWVFGSACTVMALMLMCIVIEYSDVEETSRRVRMIEAGYASSEPPPQLPNVKLLEGQRELLWLRVTTARAGMSAGDLERMRRVSLTACAR